MSTAPKSDQAAPFGGHANLAEALAAFQAELPRVQKGATGQVPGKRAYKYADLADLSATVLPLLGKHGLSWSAMPTMTEDGMLVLRYELLHVGGDSRTGDFPLNGSDNWSIGSSLTYARRFCLSAVTGVAADEDDDGVAGNEASQQRPPQRPNNQQRRTADAAETARKELLAACEKNGWSPGLVGERYFKQYQEDIQTASDAERIKAFHKLIDADPGDVKQPAEASS